jgi:hypothetical protein
MACSVQIDKQSYTFDLNKYYDISIGVSDDPQQHAHVEAFYLPNPRFEPFKAGTFIGKPPHYCVADFSAHAFAKHMSHTIIRGYSTRGECKL